MAYLETRQKGQGTRIIDALSLVLLSSKGPSPFTSGYPNILIFWASQLAFKVSI